MISKPPLDYSSFLLRLWREGEGGNMRITLQSVADDEQIHFTDLQRLTTYLHDLSETKGDRHEQFPKS